MNKKYLLILALCFSVTALQAQRKGYWQQKANYEIDVELDVKTNKFQGSSELTYYNNSGDDLQKAYFHLYFNAFQPGSAMDIRSLTIKDPDRRVGSRISKLSEEEIGFQKVTALMLDGKPCSYTVEGTILEVNLPRPIKAGSKATFTMEWNGQVPLQIRRSGRDNAEGVRYTMTQWYPKIAAYDDRGWHANPYIGREFYSPFGEYEVNITLDESYTVGGSGVLQNAREIGHGYGGITEKLKGKNGKLTWKFEAEDVHDFAWAADPAYTHKVVKVDNELTLHFLYQENASTQAWEDLPGYTVKAFKKANELFGRYPYPVYSVIQGGDGGMEYAMSTMITGHRGIESLVGVTIHEMMHSWFQHFFGFDEASYPWMDEGFTSYATGLIEDELMGQEPRTSLSQSYRGYSSLVRAELEEPMSTMGDAYHRNYAYGVAAYSKGALFMDQLEYIIGQEAFKAGMGQFYRDWKFKHPTPWDVLRSFEKASGMELDWYLQQWMNTLNTIDYGVAEVEAIDGATSRIVLEKVGRMPMPLDVVVRAKSGKSYHFTIPLDVMRGAKSKVLDQTATVLNDWTWVYPMYGFNVPIAMEEIELIMIDPRNQMADIEKSNNLWQASQQATDLIIEGN